MKYTEFTQSLKEKIEEQTENKAEVELRRIPKNNGVKMDALTILMPGETIAPAIYLQEYYLRYLDGENIENLAEKMIERSAELKERQTISVKEMKNFQKIRNRVRFRLINFEMNRELLKEVPYARVLDLACIYYYEIICPNGEKGTLIIRNTDLALWNLTADDIRAIAERNTQSFSKAEILPMRQVLCEENGMEEKAEEGDIPMYVLTNRERVFGASCLLYPDVLLPLAEEKRRNLFILPSSIHEVIVMPDFGNISKEELEHTVREINRTQVAPYEVLSDHVYYYDRRERQILM